MTQPVDSLHHYLTFIKNNVGPHEASFDALRSLLMDFPELVETVQKLFDDASDDDDKYVLAMVLYFAGREGPHLTYLHDHQDWDGEEI